MSQPSMQQVKELRDRTSAGLNDCRSAISEAGGDMEKAVEIILKKGLAKSAKRAGAVASEGVVISAVTADSVLPSRTLPRNCSMCGAPRKIHRKHGTKVVHVVIAAPSVATSVEVVSGNAQAGSPSQTLSMPVVVRVVDQYHTGMANQLVNFAVTAGGGMIQLVLLSHDQCIEDARFENSPPARRW